jgi:hypothetical protein
MSKSLVPVISTAVLLSACSISESETYTLYRSSVASSSLRIHVATFDAKDGEAYNQENCQIAMDLF